VVVCHDRAQLRPSERLSEDGVLTASTVARVAGETAHQANVRSGDVWCVKEEGVRVVERAQAWLYGARSGTDDGDGQGPPYKG
jgi:hypothetical protein